MQHISEPLLQAYIDGFCGDARRAEIESHVALCEPCRARLDQGQAAARQASKLLGTLESGPVHAPSFEELKERAIAQPAGADKVAAALEAARAATARPEKDKKRSSWHRSGLAWAATIVVAFGLGWLSRAGVDPPPGGDAAQESVTDSPAAPARQSKSEAGGEAEQSPMTELDSVGRASIADEAGEPDDRVADLRAPSTEPAAPQAASVPEEPARRQVAASEAVPPTVAEEQRVAGQQSAGEGGRRENAPPESEALSFQLNEVTPEAVGFADVADGFVVVDRDDAELWLGAPLRELTDLALLRVEVGPGALVEGGMVGRPAVRLVYLAHTGQEIALLQQYVGALDDARFVQPGEGDALKAAPADTAERVERFRSVDALGADRADRDQPAGLDLPATMREPDGRVTYIWLQPEGYLLSVSAELDADVVRGLADIVR